MRCAQRGDQFPVQWVQNIKVRLGDLWWYALMLFCVQRLGDGISMFIGLWLVPKYVPADELGAVLPLAQIGALLGVPLAILLIPFGKFLNVYATRNELGKVKSMLRDVFVLAAVASVAIAMVARYLMPLVFERMRVADGLLSWLIVMTGVTSALTPLFYQALQALKKFRQISLVGFFSAPIRLVVLLVALPIRGLSGYFAGQLAADGFGILYCLASLRRLFSRQVAFQPYWQHGREILAYTLPIAILVGAGRLQSAAEFFVIRHRLPEVESAAYYFITRFAEIPIVVWGAISMVFVPLVSERHESGKSVRSMLKQSMAILLVSGGLVALALHLSAPYIFAAVPTWVAYEPYAPLMGVAAATCVARVAFACFASYEMACRRFGFVWYTGSWCVLEAVALYVAGGISFFERWLPPAFVEAIETADLMRLHVLVWVMLAFSVALVCAAIVKSMMESNCKSSVALH